MDLLSSRCCSHKWTGHLLKIKQYFDRISANDWTKVIRPFKKVGLKLNSAKYKAKPILITSHSLCSLISKRYWNKRRFFDDSTKANFLHFYPKIKISWWWMTKCNILGLQYISWSPPSFESKKLDLTSEAMFQICSCYYPGIKMDKNKSQWPQNKFDLRCWYMIWRLLRLSSGNDCILKQMLEFYHESFLLTSCCPI